MDATIFANATQLGLGGLIFVIWFFDSKKATEMMQIIKEQVEDKKEMHAREDKLLEIIEKQSSLLTRISVFLERKERQR